MLMISCEEGAGRKGKLFIKMMSRPDLLFGSTWSIEGDSVVRGKSGDTTRKLILSTKEKNVF